MPYVKASDGANLHYVVHDFTDPWTQAPTLILQHGFSRSGRFWYSLIPYLSRFYRVVCPDLRGLGESSRDFDLPTGITPANYVSDILCIADALNVADFHFAGESLGGIIGMVLAAEHPARVRTLSLMAAPLVISKWTQKAFALDYPSWQDALRTLGSKGWSAAVNTATRFPPGTDQDLLDWYATETGKSDTEVLVAMSHVAAVVDAEPYLDRIKLPVLGLYPSGGKIATGEQEATMREKIADLTVVHLPIAFHMVWVLSPAACGNAILNFMALHDGIACHEA